MPHRSRIPALPLFPWLVILALSILTLTSCSSDDPADPPPPNDGTIGPAGGTVSDSGGAFVEIPPGALTDNVKITVETHQDPEGGPYPTSPVPIFWGGAQFGPAGTQFAMPVTIVLPTRQRLNPGDDYQLFAYDTDNQRWEITRESATVNPYGQALVSEVTHFSVFNGGGFAGGGAARDQVTELLCQFGSAAAVCEAYATYFREFVADLGDQGIFGSECQEVVGLSLDITCEINGDTATLPVSEGELVGDQVTIHDHDACGEEGSAFGVLEALATIYYRCGIPEMTAAADPTTIELGGSSTVTFTLTCGVMSFPGKTVFLAREGVGRIDAGSGLTDTAGVVEATYRNSDRAGEAVVSAGYTACPGQAGVGPVNGEVVITTTDAK